MNERNEFGEMYVQSVRDHVLGQFVQESLDNQFRDHRPGFRKAIASMNEEQLASMRVLIATITDA